MDKFEKKLIEVCSECLTASCWHGEFMCDNSRSAGTELRTVYQLRKLNKEHPDSWSDETLNKIYGDHAPNGYKGISLETVKDIKQSCLSTEKLKQLSNKELSNILMETVWAEFDMFSPGSDIIAEAIDRLKVTSTCFCKIGDIVTNRPMFCKNCGGSLK